MWPFKKKDQPNEKKIVIDALRNKVGELNYIIKQANNLGLSVSIRQDSCFGRQLKIDALMEIKYY